MKSIVSKLGQAFRSVGAAIGKGAKAGLQGVTATLRKPKWRHGTYGLLVLVALIDVGVLLTIEVKTLEDNYT